MRREHTGQARVAQPALAPHVKGDQADRLANRIIDLLDKTTGFEAAYLGVPLAALAAQLNPTARKRLLAKFIETWEPLPCNAAVVHAETREVELLVDMLRWPVCEGRDGIMLRIAELEGVQPTEFGEFEQPGNRSTFQADLRKFIAWLKMQRDSNGKPFDVDGPPIWSPGHSKGA